MNIFAVKNFKDLPVANRILFAIMGLSAPDGTFEITKSKLADYVSVSKQTVGEHLNTFVHCNLLKRKYSGKGMFNPEFYYVGPLENKKKTILSFNCTHSSTPLGKYKRVKLLKHMVRACLVS